MNQWVWCTNLSLEDRAVSRRSYWRLRWVCIKRKSGELLGYERARMVCGNGLNMSFIWRMSVLNYKKKLQSAGSVWMRYVIAEVNVWSETVATFLISPHNLELATYTVEPDQWYCKGLPPPLLERNLRSIWRRRRNFWGVFGKLGTPPLVGAQFLTRGESLGIPLIMFMLASDTMIPRPLKPPVVVIYTFYSRRRSLGNGQTGSQWERIATYKHFWLRGSI